VNNSKYKNKIQKAVNYVWFYNCWFY
jgi:hypothetical protein